MFTKQFEIRWSDIDANRHLANSAYINFMSHTRMSYLLEIGFGQIELAKQSIGPVAFYEHIFYFREVFPGKPITVSLQLRGLSEDGMFFEFLHNFYDYKGRNFASCEMMGAWIDLNERKLMALPQDMLDNFKGLEKTADFKVLTKEDTRRFNRKPKALSQ